MGFEPWDEEEVKGNKLVFIGKNLDAAALRARFAGCLATAENLEKKKAKLRFKVGDRVECYMGEDVWKPGTITELMYRDEEMEQGQVCPYKIKLDNASSTWAPVDEDDVIRKEKGAGSSSGGNKGKKRK